jgi:hypothetical protein
VQVHFKKISLHSKKYYQSSSKEYKTLQNYYAPEISSLHIKTAISKNKLQRVVVSFVLLSSCNESLLSLASKNKNKNKKEPQKKTKRVKTIKGELK